MELTDLLREANGRSTLDTDEEATKNNRVAVGLYRVVDAAEPIDSFEKRFAVKSLESWGDAHRGLSEFEEAIVQYTRVIELEPNDAIAYNNRGTSMIHLGRHEEAIEDFDKAIGLNPNDAVTYHNRGCSKKKLGLYKEAIQDYDKTIELVNNGEYTVLDRAILNFHMFSGVEEILRKN